MSKTELFCPYKGLQPYTEEDRDYFFGREEDQETISANLISSPLTILYGASGVGKTSVLLAGVAPFLRALPNVIVIVFRAWQDRTFLSTLKTEIARAVSESNKQSFAVDPNIPLDDFLAQAANITGGMLTVIFDQFEEYFLYHPQTEIDSDFDIEFARAVNREEINAHFLLTIREDRLSYLDRFQGRIPNLFGNYLRLDHLDRDAAIRAIRMPLEQYNKLNITLDSHITIEDALVDELVDQVRAGRVSIGQEGQGKLRGELEKFQHIRIETPFLQMVLTRLWDEEIKVNSRKLRLSTFERLGGAEQIVRTHLDNVITKLSDDEREICARIFRFLVTPTGIKIALVTSDLAFYAEHSTEQLTFVLKILADARILRPIAPPPERPMETLYEIFHDVLAPAVLDWRRRHMEKQKRARRFRLRIVLSFALFLFIGVVIYFAFEQKMKADTLRQREEVREKAKSLVTDSAYEQIIDNIQKSFSSDRETAEAVLSIINYFAEGIQTEFSYLASSKDDINLKEIRIKKTIQKYFESESSLVQDSNVNRKPIDDYEVKAYLYRLATLIHYKYTKVELLFDPDYLSIGTFLQTGPNSYELSLSMWQIFRAWKGYELVDSDATKRKFRLGLTLLDDGTIRIKIIEILVSETISLDAYSKRFELEK